MLTPVYYENCTKRLIELYAELDSAIVSDIARRLVKTGKMTETAKWQTKQLQESGMVCDDVLAEISAHTGKAQDEVKALFEAAGVQSIRHDNRYYTEAGLEGIVKLSDAALQTLNAGYVKCAGDLSNLTLTTAVTAQTAYINAVNSAYMQVTSGAFDYGTAIRNAVKSAAEEGVFVLYPSGRRDRLDVAVRRSVLTGVGQTVRKLSMINAGDMGCDLMEITAHAGARPEHAEWQGQLVSLSGRKGYLSTRDIGYGSGDGFGGWNCRHDWHPFFEGISQRAYSEERLQELNAKNIEYDGKMYTEYEISQIQRSLERDIRAQKRKVAAAETGAKNAADEAVKQQMNDMFTSESVKLKQSEKRLKDFLNETGQLPDNTRVWVNGFDKSVSQKAVWADKNAKFAMTAKNVDKSGGSGIIKSITVDDFEMRSYGKDVEQEVLENLISEIKKCESNGIWFSDVKFDSLGRDSKGTVALQTEMMSNGLLRLNINTDVFARNSIDVINKRFASTDSILANDLHEAMIHEQGHAKSMNGKRISEVNEMHEFLKDVHISGISKCAFSDGAECLAETEVLLSRGSKVPDEAMELYKKYVIRK